MAHLFFADRLFRDGPVLACGLLTTSFPNSMPRDKMQDFIAGREAVEDEREVVRVKAAVISWIEHFLFLGSSTPAAEFNLEDRRLLMLLIDLEIETASLRRAEWNNVSLVVGVGDCSHFISFSLAHSPTQK